MWIIRMSKPGLSVAEAWGQPLYTAYRGRFLWLARVVAWVWRTSGKVSILVLDQE